MNLDINSYVKIYKNRVSDTLCKEILQQQSSPNAIWKEHTWTNGKYEVIKNQEHEPEICDATNIPNTPILMNIVWNTIRDYVQELNTPWFSAWRGHSLVKYIRYPVETNMKMHVDFIHEIFDGYRKGIPILTVVGLLNDDFEGGEFNLIGVDQKITAGDIMIFPSTFMYPHEIKVITKGCRHSFQSWVW
jgi:predicted 2-oxoglutarate/Fe(II)-dependent dioxygenase YbiX